MCGAYFVVGVVVGIALAMLITTCIEYMKLNKQG